VSAWAAGGLAVRGLRAAYAQAPVLFGVDLQVAPSEVVALLGRNGAGKTTLVNTIAGTLAAAGGTVALDGADVTHWPPSRRYRHGLRVVRQDRPVFADLSVRDNLRLAGAQLAAAAALFGFLADRGQQQAGTLSGGEQKMLAIARVLMAPGAVCLFDEPTEGLQPANVDRFTAGARAAAAAGRAVLVVEQHLEAALSIADRWYLMERGEIVDGGPVTADTADHVADRLAP